MGEKIEVKVHNLFHEEEEFDKNKVEEYILGQMKTDKVKDVRISKGHSNSPLFLKIDSDVNNNFNNIKNLCEKAVRLFSDKVNGVDVEKCIKDKNLRVE